MKLRICIVAIYFGPLPAHFSLWLDSCSKNANFDWLLLHDRENLTAILPTNVHPIKTDLHSIKVALETGLELKLSLENPYKICDYRPAFWVLLQHFGIESEYWGHCDFDMVFGNISAFISKDGLTQYDKLLEFGHLSIYRNDAIARAAFLLPGSQESWTKVRTSQHTLGFDERHGINSIWNSNGLRILKLERSVADVLPSFRKLILGKLRLNRFGQQFYYKNGRVWQAYKYPFCAWRHREFAYIHLQKRMMECSIG